MFARRFPLYLSATGREMDQKRASVVRIPDAIDQLARFEVVQEVDHRRPVDQEGRRQVDLRQRPRLDQRAQDAPGPRGEAERLESLGRQGLRRLRRDEEQLTDTLRLQPSTSFWKIVL